MFRHFTNDDNIIDNSVSIEGNDLNHLKNTLRCKIGDEIAIINSGEEYSAKISKIDDNCILCDVIDKKGINNEPNINITIFQSLPKKTKMEIIIKQNVEIGAIEIVPIITDRTIVKISDKKKEIKKVERWQKIAKESAMQSRRNIIPKIEKIISFSETIEKIKNENYEIIVPYENETESSLKNIMSKSKKYYAIIIGPEGGFEESEIKKLKDIGAKTISLGNRILRTETAGVVTAAVVLYETNNLGGV